MNGKLIVIDGADGCGKATQTKHLLERLTNEGHKVETMDFPQYTNNYFGHLVRSFLDGKFGNPADINPYLASTLYAADRFESSKKIHTWLDDGKIVILDRYVSANQIHQGSKIENEEERKNFLNWIEKIEHGVFNIPKPDVILYLDVSTNTAQKLLDNRAPKDKVESDLKYQNDSRTQSLRLISQMNSWKRIICEKNGELLSIDEIHNMIWETLQNMI